MVCLSLEIQTGCFDSFGAEWDRLLSGNPMPNAFLSRTWQKTWWDQFGGSSELRLIGFRDAGELVALAPLMARDGVISFLGGTDLVDYHDILSTHHDCTAVAEELFCALDRYDDWHTIDLGSLPNWSPYLEAFVSAAEKRGWGTTTEQEDVAPGVELPPSWDEYLAGLRKKDRHELRRKMRRLEAAGELEQRVFSTASDIDANFIEFVRLHKLSTPEKNEFLTPERESFFRTVTRYLAREGRVRMYFTSLSGVTVATSLCHEVEGRRFVYNSGYDPEYSRLAVGLLNHALFIKSSIAEGISYADFMRGDERYKYHLGARDRIISRLVIQRRQESGLLRE